MYLAWTLSPSAIIRFSLQNSTELPASSHRKEMNCSKKKSLKLSIVKIIKRYQKYMLIR